MGRYGNDPMDFGPSEDVYQGYELREEETARGPLILALAAGVLIVFGAVVWNTYRQGVRAEGAGLPVITAEVDEYKRRPDEVGGVLTPDMDRRIYDELDGSTRSADGPEARRAVFGGADERLQGGPMDVRPEAPAQSPLDALDEQQRALAELGGSPAPLGDTAQQTASLGGVSAATAAREAARQSGLPPATNVATPQPVIPAAPTPAPVVPGFAFNSSGSYLVQIAALRDQAGADRAWNALAAQHPAIFTGAEKRVQHADLGARGVFFRLRAGAFATRSDAAVFCDALKATGNDCIVVQ